MNCDSCNSNRMVIVSGKVSDMCYVEYMDAIHQGDVPSGLNIGSGDYIELNICMNCGKVQGQYPIVEINLGE